MATAAYYQWVSAGKPLTPCIPIRQVVERLKLAFPKAAAKNLFSWYANDAHYEAEPAQDHTPFSQTGWPLPSPWYVVFATDIMHRPDLGVDCHKLFAYWIAEARAGRMRWLKYLIWQGKSYDVRNEWAPRSASGHFDHIHMSTRTDHQNTHLGTWSLIPEEDELDAKQAEQLASISDRVGYALAKGQSPAPRGWTADPDDTEPLWIVEFLTGIKASVDQIAAPVVTVDPEAIKQALLDPEVQAAIAKAVNDDAAARMAD